MFDSEVTFVADASDPFEAQRLSQTPPTLTPKPSTPIPAPSPPLSRRSRRRWCGCIRG
ncbi:MAG: hypothetical protein WDM85_15535 [Caulobacteraceae bacterium]